MRRGRAAGAGRQQLDADAGAALGAVDAVAEARGRAEGERARRDLEARGGEAGGGGAVARAAGRGGDGRPTALSMSRRRQGQQRDCGPQEETTSHIQELRGSGGRGEALHGFVQARCSRTRAATSCGCVSQMKCPAPGTTSVRVSSPACSNPVGELRRDGHVARADHQQRRDGQARLRRVAAARRRDERAQVGAVEPGRGGGAGGLAQPRGEHLDVVRRARPRGG